MRSQLDALLTEKSISFVHTQKNLELLNIIIEQDSDGAPETRNVCAKVSPQLAERIDQVCQMLDIRKRAFLEAAFVEAIQKAEEIMRAEGVYEIMQEDAQ
jgi:hypothetical protein